MVLAARFAAAAVVLLGANVFASEVIVDTGLGAGSKTSVFNRGASNFQSIAAKFDLSDRYTLTDLEGSFTVYAKSAISISILSDSKNSPGETLMFSSLVTPATNIGYADTWVGLHNQSLTLNAGSYWIVFGGVIGEPLTSAPGMGMYNVARPLSEYRIMNALNGFPPRWLSEGGGRAYGVRIQGQAAPVPEASALTMSLIGVATVAVARLLARRRPFAGQSRTLVAA